MSEHQEHNPGDHEDPLPGPTWLIGFIGAVLLVVVFLGLVSIFSGAEEEEIVTKVYDVEPMELEQLRAAQLARLEGPARVEVTVVDNQETDRRIVIPIERAMELVVQETTSRP